MLLLHGFTHTGASWQGVTASLPESYRPIAPDLRGHGAASALEPVTLDAVLGDLEVTGGERFALCGYSMGGRIALHLALAAPERVERLVLIGASPGLADPSERAARRAQDERLAGELERMGRDAGGEEGKAIEAFARRWATSTAVLAGQPAHVAERVHEDRLRNTPAGLARALRGLGTGALPSLWDRLGDVTMPVALVVGERDRKFHRIAEQMAALLPRATMEVVPDAGHAVHLEAPEQVAALLARATAR